MDSVLMNIQPNETKITGNWVIENGKPVADAAAKRINHIIKNDLVKIGCSDDGWSVLFWDKKYGHYWELTYIDSSWHGGGAPSLELLSNVDANVKYKISD